MHIVYPIGTFYPAQSGGPSNSVYWLAQALVRQGVRVSVVTTDTDQPAATPRDKWLTTDAGRVRYVRTRQHTLAIRAIWQSLRVLPQADVVHLTSLFYTTSLLVGLVALWQRKAVVWSPRGELASAALAIRPRLKWALLNVLRYWQSRLVFHTTSPAETAATTSVFGAQVRIVELPNYLPLALPVPRQPGRYLLYLGRLHPIKALDQLIRAAARSEPFRTGQWQLKLVGPDADGLRLDLRKLADELGIGRQVQIEGPVTGAAKQHLLANAHALVLPSHSENFGNVVVEALAQGTLVIASTGTPWSVLTAHKAGFWVDNQVDSLSKAMGDCLCLSAHQYALYRQNALRLAQSQFDSHANSHRWLDAYQRVLDAHRKAIPTLCAE